ncbi:MAG: energy transducer TonB [Opitutaceae bacterium]|nr:energy transducer TonB [Opitutaceae bacterium]
MAFRSTLLRSTTALMLSAGGIACAAVAPVPFDFGLPPFEVLMQSLPKWGDNLIEVNVARERYDVTRDVGNGNKPPQIYSSPVLMPAAWPRELQRGTIEAVFSFSLDSQGAITDIARLSELHPALERVANLYIARLRYTPAEKSGKASPAKGEITLRFQTDGIFPD